MSTIRVQGIPAAANLKDICRTFNIEEENCVSLASSKTTSPPSSQIATVTLRSDTAAKNYSGEPVRVHGKEVLIDRDFLGLTVLSSGVNDTTEYLILPSCDSSVGFTLLNFTNSVDIVAVHGLSGHAFNTWTFECKMWLRDFLPTQLPRARIMTYGYNSYLRGSTDVSTFRTFAQRLLVSIDEKRSEQDKDRPIVFICHSLGGIVVKLALNIARVEERTRIINNVTYGIVFLATPHQGSKTAEFGVLVSLIAKASNIRKELVKGLRTDSARLLEIADEFRQYHNILQIATFYETKKTQIKGGFGLNAVVVDQRSAVLGLQHEQQSPLHRDHREICRFRHEEEVDYKALFKQIERMVEKAPDAVKTSLSRQESRQKFFFMVPYAENENFTGRESIVEQLEQCLSRKSSHQRVALWGLGGVGKTQVALEHAYAQKKDCSVFWVHASSQERFSQDYRKLSRLAQIPVSRGEEEEEEVLSNVKDWLESTESGEWILILDNADDLLLFFPRNTHTTKNGSTSQIILSKFIPQGSKGTIIITTRDRQLASRLTNNSSIQIVTMQPDEARDLFSRLGPIGTAAQDQESLSQLLEELDYLPLAIAQAAAYMRENLGTPSQYFALFNKTKETQKALLRVEFSDYRRESDVPEAVLTTYFITFEQLRNQNPLAANLLRLIGFLDRQGLPRKLLTSSDFEDVHDDIRFDTAIGKLLALSLITQTTDTQTYEVHRLVHLSIQESLPPNKRLELQLQALKIICELFPNSNHHENWTACAVYLPHATVVIQSVDGPGKTKLLTRVAGYLRAIGRYKEAEEHLSRCLEMLEPEDNLGIEALGALSLLALVLGSQGRYREAEITHRRVQEGREKVLGPEHRDFLVNMGNLADVLRIRGKYSEAEKINWQVLEEREKLLGPEDDDTLTSMNNLAVLLDCQGKYEEAEEMNRRVLERWKKVLGPEHPDTLNSMNNLAMLLDGQGEYREAENLNQQVLEGRKKVLGPEHPDALTSMNNLAMVLRKRGKYDKAEEMNRQVLKEREKVLGSKHPDTLASMNNLAMCLGSQGKYDEAEEMQRQVLERSEKVLGPENPDTLSSMNNLALSLESQGKYGEAEEMHRQVLGRREKVLRPEHPDTLISMNNLGTVLWRQGRYYEAQEMHQVVLGKREKFLGPEHPETLASMNNLAMSLKCQGKYSDAEKIQRQVLEGSEKVLGLEHPNTLSSMNNLALSLESQGKYNEAGEIQRRVLEMRVKVLGPEHPKTVETRKWLLENHPIEGSYGPNLNLDNTDLFNPDNPRDKDSSIEEASHPETENDGGEGDDIKTSPLVTSREAGAENSKAEVNPPETEAAEEVGGGAEIGSVEAISVAGEETQVPRGKSGLRHKIAHRFRTWGKSNLRD